MNRKELNLSVEEHEIFDIIGEDGFRRICSEFYRQVPEDDLLGPMYPLDDLENAEGRLRDFLIYRFGGPPTYIEERGHPRLRMRHAPFAINQAARDRWVQLMAHAIEQADIAPEAAEKLTVFFDAMASFLINRQD